MSLGELALEYEYPGELTLGRSVAPVILPVEFSASFTLNPVAVSAEFLYRLRLQHQIAIAWKAQSSVYYQSRLASRSLGTVAQSVSIKSVSTDPLNHRTQIPWNCCRSVFNPVSLKHEATDPITISRSTHNSSASVFYTAQRLLWNALDFTVQDYALTWNAAVPVRVDLRLSASEGELFVANLSIPFSQGALFVAHPRLIWQQAILPPNGWRPVITPPVDPTHDSGELALVCPLPASLTLGRACFGKARLLVPVKRSYCVLNAGSIVRISDSADIAAQSVSLFTSIDQWCWSVEVSSVLGRAAYETIPPYPDGIKVTINGFAWNFIVDDAGFVRKFGSFGASLTGRGFLAALSSPFHESKTYLETATKTVAQLALQEVPYGFDLDWQLPDWTVPSRVFQYQNLTPMEVLNRLAKSAGGRVVSDPIGSTIRVIPKWPRKPWAWNAIAADVTLPSAYVLSETLKLKTGNEFESILVSGGVNGGVAAWVKRTGTGGLVVAPSVVDALITDNGAAEGRGIQELADAWPMRTYTLDLPLQAEPDGAGLLLPGTTLDFDDDDPWRGLVVSTRISASVSNGGLTVSQQLELVSP